MFDNYYKNRMHLSALYEEIDGYSFYTNIFPNNENKGEFNSDYSKPNSIYLYQDTEVETELKLKRRLMLKDMWEQDYLEFVYNNPMTLCSGLAYRRNKNNLDNAQRMHALIFDLDNVGEAELRNLIERFGKNHNEYKALPIPTYIVLSGTGVHLYYVFQEPIDLYENIKEQLKKLKYDITKRLWDYQVTTKEKQIQYQSINQGFRMIGSINKKYNVEVLAYEIGEKVTVEYINKYVTYEKNKLNIQEPFKKSKISIEEAKIIYPDWYEKVVVRKDKRIKKWDIKSKQGYALYEWWINQVDHIKGGHRYFFLMCMSIYACKCDVPKEKLEKDMEDIYNKLKSIKHTNPLSSEDIACALEAYDKDYYNFRISDIENLTEIKIKRNPRNYQNRNLHLETMRNRKAEMKLNGEKFKKPEGRPNAEKIVKEWQEKNPNNNSKNNCIKETGLSKPTVYRWWE